MWSKVLELGAFIEATSYPMVREQLRPLSVRSDLLNEQMPRPGH